MATKVHKVYSNGELVYDITGEPVVPPDPPDPLPEGSITFAFAEIPEVVFASGYADADEMNMFHTDMLNLYPTGKMPWDGTVVFTPRLKCTLVGTLPSYLSWNENTGYLSYDGTAITTKFIGTFHFYQGDTEQTSDDFEIKVLIPKVEWAFSDAGEVLNDVLLAELGNDTEENVVVIKDGEYFGTDLRANADGYMNGFNNLTDVYLIGEYSGVGQPLPILSGNKYDNWALEYDSDRTNWGSRLLMYADNIDHLHIKNLDLRYCNIKSDGCRYGALTRVKIRSYISGVDGWTTSWIKEEKSEDSQFFISTFETYHYGAGELKHPVYGHGIDEYTDNITGRNGHIFVNNYKAYESKAAGDLYGGHSLKLRENYSYVRNSWFSLTADPDNIDTTKTGHKPPISMHSTQRAVLFNVDFYTFKDSSIGKGGANYALLFQSRNMPSARGQIVPAYFASPAMATSTLSERVKKGYGCWENWAGDDIYSGEWVSVKNSDFHGDNANYNYSETGTKEDLTPNSTRAPVAAPFWDTIGDCSVPTNENAYYKFISHCRFHTITTPTPEYNKVAMTNRTTAPSSYQASAGSVRDFLPVPPNWVERTWLYTCNNTFNGYNDSSYSVMYEVDFEEPRSVYDYPYSVKSTAAVTKDNVTHLGGDIIDDDGTNMAIPNWFKV